jgi:cytochrome c oxidase cbb3-type subunit 3
MQASNRVIVAAIGGLALALAVTVRAQQQPTQPSQPPTQQPAQQPAQPAPPQAPPATQTPPPRPPGAVETPPAGEHGGQATTPAPQGQGGQGSRREQARFPAHQRPPADPAVVARGKAVFAGSCGACHGADGRGGQLGGANLLRSQLVLNDKDGELIGPVVLNGRPGTLMPPIPVAPDDIKAIATYLHDLQSKGTNQGGPPPGEAAVVLNVLVGDAKAGAQYFAKQCGACHSASGDLQGIGTRIPDAKVLQNVWVSGGAARMRGPGSPTSAKPPAVPTATITLPTGETATGRLVRLDDFTVTIAQEDGTQRSFRRKGDVPKVDVKDPLQGHRDLLPVYTDKNMHDVTAYLASLK